MDFPTIHTNFWDAVIAVPVVMIITQMIKKAFKIQKKFVPLVATVLGYAISIFISHRGDLIAGIIMGYFYGYAAIGSYVTLKNSIKAFKQKFIIKKQQGQPL
jgi:hypothetical protein